MLATKTKFDRASNSWTFPLRPQRSPLWRDSRPSQRIYFLSALTLTGLSLLTWTRVWLAPGSEAWTSFALLSHCLAAIAMVLAWVLRGLPVDRKATSILDRALPYSFVVGAMVSLITASITIETTRFSMGLGLFGLGLIGVSILGTSLWALQWIEVRGTQRRSRFFALAFLAGAFFLAIAPVLSASLTFAGGRLDLPVLLCVAGGLIPTAFRLSLKKTNANERERRLIITAASVSWGLIVLSQAYQAYLGLGPLQMGPLALAPFVAGLMGLVLLTGFVPWGWFEFVRTSEPCVSRRGRHS